MSRSRKKPSGDVPSAKWHTATMADESPPAIDLTAAPYEPLDDSAKPFRPPLKDPRDRSSRVRPRRPGVRPADSWELSQERSLKTKQSWANDPELAARRAQKHNVWMDNQFYKSVRAALKAIRAPYTDHKVRIIRQALLSDPLPYYYIHPVTGMVHKFELYTPDHHDD